MHESPSLNHLSIIEEFVLSIFVFLHGLRLCLSLLDLSLEPCNFDTMFVADPRNFSQVGILENFVGRTKEIVNQNCHFVARSHRAGLLPILLNEGEDSWRNGFILDVIGILVAESGPVGLQQAVRGLRSQIRWVFAQLHEHRLIQLFAKALISHRLLFNVLKGACLSCGEAGSGLVFGVTC